MSLNLKFIGLLIKLGKTASPTSSATPLTKEIEQRGIHLHGLGFKHLDALHLIAAECLKADAMLTTDDQLLRIASRHLNQLTIAVMNPVHFTTD